MPPKLKDTTDLYRGERLVEERKKFWKSRENCSTDTGLSAASIKSWEARGGDIPSSALTVLASYGIDITYILTGERSSHLPKERGILNDDSQNSRVAELETRVSEQRELIEEQRERIKLQKETIEELRDKLADFGRGASVG